MPYKLRDKVVLPGRYRETDDDPLLPENAKFVHPTVPFNPNLPRAAFPTLDPFDPLPRPTATSTDPSGSHQSEAGGRDQATKKALVFRSEIPAPVKQKVQRESENSEPHMVIEDWLQQSMDPMEPGKFVQNGDWWDEKKVSMKALQERMKFGHLPDNMQYILFNEVQSLGPYYQANAEIALNMEPADRDHVIDLCLEEQSRVQDEQMEMNEIVQLSRAGMFQDDDDDESGSFSDKLLSGFKSKTPIDSLVSRNDIRQAEIYLKQEGLWDMLKGSIRSYLGIRYSDDDAPDRAPAPEIRQVPVEEHVPAPEPRPVSSRPRSRLSQEFLPDAFELPILAPQDDDNDPDFKLKKSGSRRPPQTTRGRATKRQKAVERASDTPSNTPARSSKAVGLRTARSRNLQGGRASHRNTMNISYAQGVPTTTVQSLGDMQSLPAHAPSTNSQTQADNSPMRLVLKVGSSGSSRNIESPLGRHDNSAEEASVPELTDRTSTPASAILTPQDQSPTSQPVLQNPMVPTQNESVVPTPKSERTKRRAPARPKSGSRRSGTEAPTRQSRSMLDTPEGGCVSTKSLSLLQDAYTFTPAPSFPINSQPSFEVRNTPPTVAVTPGMDTTSDHSPILPPGYTLPASSQTKPKAMAPPKSPNKKPVRSRNSASRIVKVKSSQATTEEANTPAEQDATVQDDQHRKRVSPRRNKRLSRKSAENMGP